METIYINVVGMKVKVLSIIICVCCLFSTTVSLASETGNIIVVDDEGDGDYTSIKEALSFANPGDTIEVYSGIYYEYDILIVINNITLKGMPYELGNGSDVGKPFINGEGKDDLIKIRAGNVTIDGFRMENDGSGSNCIIIISHDAHGCTIANNDIAYTSMSCIWIDSSNNLVMNNNISHSSMRKGICLREPSTNNLVSDNVISDCQDGIVLWDSDHNLIERNIIQNCSRFGIDNTYKNNTIQYNLFKDNLVGYNTYFAMHSTITYNNFINNEVQAQFSNSRLRYLITNKWIGNYWDRGRILPYPIRGSLFIFPWIQFDWRPALVPNEI